MAFLNKCGDLVRQAREEKGWSKEQLVEALKARGRDATVEGITLLEDRQRKVLVEELLDLAWVLEVNIDDLVPTE
jgi:ribosome-binding protein aMBF1 (putative translation factor)